MILLSIIELSTFVVIIEAYGLSAEISNCSKIRIYLQYFYESFIILYQLLYSSESLSGIMLLFF